MTTVVGGAGGGGEFVLIWIDRVANPIKIEVSQQESRIYRSKSGIALPKDHRPEVLWCALNIGADEVLRVEAKHDPQLHFEHDEFEMSAESPCVASGPVKRAAPVKKDTKWPYNVVLYDRRTLTQKIPPLDPTIIINSDP